MRRFSAVRLCDAEQGVHEVFQREGYTCPIRIDSLDLGPGQLKKFPYIKVTTWMQHLLETNRLCRQMVGVASIPKMKLVLKEYWNRFKKVRPTHGVFDLAEQGVLQLDCCIPFYSHSDEGRSQKHLPLFVLSTHGVLGRGTRAYISSGRHRAPLRRNQMGMNFVGKTWSTQFMFATVLKSITVEYPDVVDTLVKEFSADCHRLLHQGIISQDGQAKFWFCHVGTKGDLPALQKLGSFKRSFSHVPKGPSSKKACKGICFKCKAGQEHDASVGQAAYPFEDVNRNALWTTTLHTDAPWDVLPSIVTGLPLDLPSQIDFFRTDLWRNAHLGILRQFVASGFVAIVESQQSDLPCLPDGSIDAKFQWLTNLYRQFWRAKGRRPVVLDINRETMLFPASTASPVGKWSKGQASTEMMLFLEHFGQQYIRGKTANVLLNTIVSWLGCHYLWDGFCTVILFYFPFGFPHVVGDFLMPLFLSRLTQLRTSILQHQSSTDLGFGWERTQLSGLAICYFSFWPSTHSVPASPSTNRRGVSL